MRTLMRTYLWTGIVLLAVSVAAFADTASICDNTVGNLVLNCGFEANLGAAPTSWTTDAGWALHAGTFNQAVNISVNSGSNALQFGNLDAEGLAGIFQSIADVPGAQYSVSFYVFDHGAGGDPGSLFNALLNSAVQVTQSNGPASYTQFSYDFTGSGSDTIGFQAQTNPAEWYLDDVVVLGPAPGQDAAVPEPRQVDLTALGLVILAGAHYLLQRRHRAPKTN